MNFLYPEWFYALLLIPLLLIGVVVKQSNKKKVWGSFVGNRHEQRLVTRGSKARSWGSFGISLIALSCIILAMTRPYQGKTTLRDKIQTRNIIVAIDCSLSMLCEDAGKSKLSRLDAAKTVANNLVDAFPEDHIGVMAFAGSANLISSITIDHPSVKEAINQVDNDSAHLRGSDLTNSISLGIETLKKAGKSANALIILSDGTEDAIDISKLTKAAKKAQVQIFTIGVGSSSGGPIPVKNILGKIEPHRDRMGRVVITKLEDSALRQLATATSGSYSHATNANQMIAEAVQSMNRFEMEGRTREVPNELYHWFLAPGILLLVVSVLLKTHWQRKSSATMSGILAMAILGASTDGVQAQRDDSFTANAKTQLFTKPADIRTGYQALEEGKYEKAIKHLDAAVGQSSGEQYATLSLALAQAYYRNKNFPEAIKAYADATISSDPTVQVDAQYNMGNALFRNATKHFEVPEGMPFDTYLDNAIRGKNNVPPLLELAAVKKNLRNAISKYSDTLRSKSEHTQASKNRQVADKLLKDIEKIQESIRREQEAEEEKRKKNQEKQQKEQEKKSKKDGEKGDEEKGKGEKGKGEKGKGEKGKGEKGKGEKGKGEKGKGEKGEGEKGEGRGEKGKVRKAKNSNNNSKSSDVEFASEEEAMEFMKKSSDLRKKPTRNSNRWRNAEKDW